MTRDGHISSAFLDDLNPPQREAVTTVDGPLLVLAGAGSGKTRVLTHRIAHLVRNCGVAPWNILAVTFTNKAAGEMRERVEQLFGRELSGAWVTTFHSACLRLLRQEIHHLGYTNHFVVYDQGDSLSLVKKCLKELNIDERLVAPRRAQTSIEKAKHDLVGPERLGGGVPGPITQEIAKVYALYQKELKRNGACDFGDLIMLAVRLLEENEEVRTHYQQKFRYLLVDEYQDTDRAQYRLLRLLAAGHHNLCVVGDDDQSIYRWRGADLNNILNFEKDFSGARVVRLEQNYRSTKRILAGAGAVIATNMGRKGKTLWTENPEGDRITFYRADDERDEAEWVVRTMGELSAGGRRLSDCAVFYRTNAQSRVIEDTLVRENLPYQVVGGVRFYERAEIKDVMAYLKVMANPADSVRDFESLFRMHLSNLYHLLGQEPPEYLAHTFARGSGDPDMGGVMRQGQAAD